MCGIVGYLGPSSPKDVLLDGLKKLEYRGYDSAGVAILNDGQFKRVRAEGKLGNLEKKLSGEKFNGRLGIGHTRWATHGVVSERNAHPHAVQGVSIVHNGIIENYAQIRGELEDSGVRLETETDSELVAHLIAKELEKKPNLYEACCQIIPRLRGAYSILAVWENAPDTLVAFKNGPPLVLGIGEKEMLVASDVQAIISHTDKVVHLDDKEVACVEGLNYRVTNGQGKSIKKPVVTVDWTADQVEKQGYSHFMLKEIFEQPRAVAAAIEPHVDLQTRKIKLSGVGFSASSVEELDSINLAQDEKVTEEKLKGIDRVFIVACGTSYYAGMVGEYLVEKLSGLPVEIDIASEFRYRNPVIPKNSLVLVISQSGETADTLAALRLVKAQGALTMSLCNVRCSSIDRESDGHLYMNAGVEVGVASTKAFAATLATLNVLALYLAKIRDRLKPAQEEEYLNGLLAVPSHMEHVLAYESFFAKAASTLKQFKGFLYMGRGINYPIAMEGALKLKELAYMHAEGYAAGEMKHGPLALIDKNMAVVMLVPSDELFEKTVSNLEQVRVRGGNVISIGSGKNEKLQKLSQHYIALPEAHWTVNPLLEVIPVQLLAFHVADALGHDVDQPRNLAKSVTVE